MMNDDHKALNRLLEDVFSSDNTAIHCDEAVMMMARSATAQLSEAASRREYPQLWQHFRVCVNCADEYLMIVGIAQLEATGQLPQPETIPPLPEAAQPSIWDRAKTAAVEFTAIRIPFPGFTSDLAAAVTRSLDLGLAPVRLTLAAATLYLEIDLSANEADPALRDLFCTVSADDPALEAAFEGSSVWLQVGDDGSVLREQALDELGDVTLAQIPPGAYTLKLHLAKQDYVVTDLVVP